MRTLRLWFSFDVPVGRGAYFTSGLALMAVKYAVDAAAIWFLAGRAWTPLDYFNPLLTVRMEVLRGAPPWLGPALIVFALPFLWIGVSMSARRAVDAGRSPWLALLFFVPVVNYLLMAVLSVLPSLSTFRWPVEAPGPQVDERLKSALLGVAATIGITLATVAVGVYLRRAYSTGLFLGAPFTIAYSSAYIYNRRQARWLGETLVVGLASVLVAGGAVILFAVEGAVCTVLALPVAAAVAVPGALLGRTFAIRALGPASGPGAFALLAPLLVLVEPRQDPAARQVVSVVEIDAPPAVVWRSVVQFPELPAPREWLFRAGIAAPVGARIEGAGVGAVRYCDFNTGSFVEPITAWEEGRLLAFDITDQPPPMRELSPYGAIHAPHLDGYFRATHGEFRLEEMPGRRARLVGTTRYVVDMFPQMYWRWIADQIVEAVHQRVLGHIQRLAEEVET